MDRLSSRLSIGDRLARLSTNWGLPDALARLGLADPSAPQRPGPHLGPPHPSPIAEEGGAGQAAEDCLQAGIEQQQKEQQQQQQQQVRQCSEALEAPQSAAGSKRLHRQSAQQHKHSAVSNAAKLLSESVLLQRRASDITGTGNGRDSEATARQTVAEHTTPGVPVSSSSPAGRAAFASIGNAQSSPSQGEMQRLAQGTVCAQAGIYMVHHRSSDNLGLGLDPKP